MSNRAGTDGGSVEIPVDGLPPAPVPSARDFALALFLIGISTALALALRPYVAATNLVMVYLLCVVAVALRCGRQVSVLTSFLSVAAFDFFCVPPYLTFRVHDYEYLLTFAAMLVVALIISTQTARIRKQAADAVVREARSQTLYHLSRRLAGQNRLFDMARIAAEYAAQVFQNSVVIFLPENGRIGFAQRSCDRLPISRDEEPIAQWVFDHGEKAGRGTENYSSATAFYLPLKSTREVVGVMAIVAGDHGSFAGDQTHLLELFAHQTATAMESARSQHSAEAARIQMQTEQMRSSLLSAVSHDLRTPLASITGAASTLRSQGEKLLPETRQELLDSIAEEAERLGRLVSNLLDMTRLESGVELRRDLYPLEEIVGSALQRMERQLSQRRVTTHLPDSLPLVSVDDVLLGQLLVNLLENATKYTPEGTPIEVAAESSGDAITLEVRDRGPGFAPHSEQRIFEKFYRGRSDGSRGAGLGLAICRAIAEAHRGTIEAFNRSGGGAVFRIRLPLGAYDETGGRAMKPFILIVEDDPQIRRFLRATLTAEGYIYYEALTAAEGLAQVNARRPDLILLDLGLPDRDGLEVIRRVRESSQMPIVVLSARGEENDKIAALDLGADDYVAKPFGVGELLARIRAALRRSAAVTPEGAILRFGRIEIDVEKRIVKVEGEEVHLTPNEYRLLQVLIKYPGKVLTQRQLLNEVWGPNHLDQAQYLRVYIAQLRRKLESDPARPKHLQTEPGVGYRLIID